MLRADIARSDDDDAADGGVSGAGGGGGGGSRQPDPAAPSDSQRAVADRRDGRAGGLYLLQGAEFVAAVQIIVYGGAIMVLFIFVIMLLNAGEEERTNVSRMARFVGVPLGIVFLVEVAYWIGRATSHLARRRRKWFRRATYRRCCSANTCFRLS